MELLSPDQFELAMRILAGTRELTLATVRSDGSPHASTVHFASEGLVLYAAISIDSGKAHDLHGDGRVALTVNAPYAAWSDIQGLSIDGVAAFVRDPGELALASTLLLRKLPAFESIIAEPDVLPWPGMLFIRVTPLDMLMLDYSRGFGHTESFDLRTEFSDTA
jgi:hypothetical protein